MEIIKKFLSPAGKNKLATYTKKQKSTPLYVVGIHVCDTELTCSKPQKASGQKSTGLPRVTSHCKKASWNGVVNFVVPPDCLDFLCTKDSTYRAVISAFLKESVLSLIEKPVDGIVIAAFSFPVHSLWDNSNENLQSLLDQCFADCKWLIPAVVSLFEHKLAESSHSFIYVDRKWTTFLLDKKKYSVAFGTDTDFGGFRCNDYLNNSTLEWMQNSYMSWEGGFSDICRTLSKFQKGRAQSFMGVGDEKYRDRIGRALINCCLTADAVVWENPADITANILLASCKNVLQPDRKSHLDSSSGHQKKREHCRFSKSKTDEQERQIKTTEDLFKMW